MSRLLCALMALALAPGLASAAPDCPSPPGTNPDQVVARYGKQTLKLKALDAEIAAQLCAAHQSYLQAVQEARQAAVERMVVGALIEQEAKAQKVANGRALVQQIASKGQKAPTEEAIKEVYEANKQNMGGAPLEQVRGEIVTYLQGESAQAAVNVWIEGLKEKAKVKILLEPWRVNQKGLDEGPGRGPGKAPITIVEFADFECPFCATGQASLQAVKEKYGDKVRVIFRDYPLGFHPNAEPAAVAARCAGQQGHYWAMHDALFALEARLPEDFARATAGQIKGMDMKVFEACLGDPAVLAKVQADAAFGAQVGVEGTPAFFINGIPLSGAQPPAAFFEIIDAELARLKK